jgi:two-component system sensor histidine kinase EvgS
MPVMNGYDLTRAIRQHERQTGRQPCTVLGFTANAQPEEIQRCKRAGMNDCLFKPLSLNVLSEWISTLQPAFVSPPFNLQGLNQLTGGQPAQTRRLLLELLNSSRLDRQELLALAPECDREALAEVAHKIKGAARIAQASQVIECCEALEQACLQASSVQEIALCREAGSQAMLDLERALEQQLQHNSQSTMTEP